MSTTHEMITTLPNDICTQVDDLLTDYALGTLGPDESDFVARNLSLCPDQASDLTTLGSVVDMMGAATPPMVASEQIWTRLADETAPAASIARPVPITRAKSRSRTVTVPRWAMAIAAALILVLTGSTFAMGYAMNHDDSPTSPMAATMAYYMTSGAKVVPLASQSVPENPGWSGKGALLVANGMAPLLVLDNCQGMNKASTYNVWLAVGTERTPMGQVSVDGKGRGMMTITGIDSLNSYDMIGISVKMDDGGFYDLIEGSPHTDI